MLLFYLLGLQQARLELNLQILHLLVFHELRDIDSVGKEHVVGLQNCLAVQFHMGESIETVKRENYSTATMLFWSFECSPVGPRLCANPFCFDLIEADKRVLQSRAPSKGCLEVELSVLTSYCR